MTEREAIETLESECGCVELDLADGTEHSKAAMDFVAACHIAVKALREYARLKAELELAKRDIIRLVNENEPCQVCNYENCADCEDDITGFVWRGLPEWWGLEE